MINPGSASLATPPAVTASMLRTPPAPPVTLPTHFYLIRMLRLLGRVSCSPPTSLSLAPSTSQTVLLLRLPSMVPVPIPSATYSTPSLPSARSPPPTPPPPSPSFLLMATTSSPSTPTSPLRFPPPSVSPTTSPSSKSFSTRPYPCSSSPPSEPLFCSDPTSPVTIANKIGGFFSIPVPDALLLKDIHFDFVDTLLESPFADVCSSASIFCSYYEPTHSVSSLSSECNCVSPSLDANECALNPQIALFSITYPSPNEAYSSPRLLSLSGCSFSN